ncbi:MAG: hypothetical protein JXR83_12405 [Deltaproteobacteria bacterium]|nr:hypothetical protein [Deltaproteobacteria bacterium]
MRRLTLLALIALGGCNWICGKAAETIVETATGVEIDQQGKQVTVKTKEGTVTATQTGGPGGTQSMVITNEKGDKVVVSGSEKQARIESDKGVIEYGGNAKVPEGFPLSVIGGATVLGNAHHTSEGKESYMLMLQLDKPPLAVADHYASELTSKGFKIQRTQMNANGQDLATVTARKDKIQAQVTAIADGQKPKTQVTLAWEAR